MKTPYFHIDAFTLQPHHGNPAGVCLLETWLNEKQLQDIASENNLSETAFLVRKDTQYEIRWFTPTSEINLCGHATLASGFVIFNFLKPKTKKIIFQSHLSGKLSVENEEGLLTLNFPSLPAQHSEIPSSLITALGKEPVEVLKADDYLVVFDKEETVSSMKPNFQVLKQLDARGVIVTSTGSKCDFVSRFFCPKFGINEDPVTGSAHCTLIPYWKSRLKKKKLYAQQLSQRGGELFCEDLNDRVSIAGNAVCYMEGHISI